MKKVVILFLTLFFFVRIVAQTDHFMIGVYSYSYDNASPTYHAGINTFIGNSSEFLNLFKEYNFNTIQVENQLMPEYTNPVFAPDSPSKTFLDRADSLGLKIILTCPDLYVNQRLDSLYLQDSNYTQYDSTRSHNGLNYYGDHPALLGFAITDEPTPRMFSDISRYFADIEQYNPNLLRQANLLPAYASDTDLGFPGAEN